MRFFYLFLCFMTSLACAGELVPTRNSNINSISLTRHFVETKIINQIAFTQVTQVFYNNDNRDLEAIYEFSIPKNARIDSLAMWIGGKRMDGVVTEKSRGRHIYEEIMRRKIDPALLEHIAGSTYRLRIYPVLAKQQQRIQLTYWQILNCVGGQIDYTYPLHMENIPNNVKFAFTMNIQSDSTITHIDNHHYPLSYNKTDKHITASFETKNNILKEDIHLYYKIKARDYVNIMCFRDPKESEGYFIARINVPENKPSKTKTAITFVIDSSASMSKANIALVKQAMFHALEILPQQYFFNIASFATNYRALYDKPALATNINKKAGHRFINKINYRGSTNLSQALETALKTKIPQGAKHTIVLFTDGQPSAGETHFKTLLESTRKQRPTHTRIFTIGIGDAIDRGVIESLAQENKGISLIFEDGERPLSYLQENGITALDLEIKPFINSAIYSLATDIKLNFGQAEITNTHPKNIKYIYYNSSLLIIGRYRHSEQTSVDIKGAYNNKAFHVIQEVSFAEKNTENTFIPKLWASAKIDQLLYNIRQQKSVKKNIQQVITLSKRWGIITPYTSYLVLETEEDYKHWGLKEKNPRSKKQLSNRELKNSLSPVSKELLEARHILKSLKESGINIDALRSVEKAIDGVVTATSPTLPLVMLSVGSDDGVKKGYQFTVYRGSRYVGKVVVEEVYKDAAAARIVKSATLRRVNKGDSATTRFGGSRRKGSNPIDTGNNAHFYLSRLYRFYSPEDISGGKVLSVRTDKKIVLNLPTKTLNYIKKYDIYPYFSIYRGDLFIGIIEKEKVLLGESIVIAKPFLLLHEVKKSDHVSTLYVHNVIDIDTNQKSLILKIKTKNVKEGMRLYIFRHKKKIGEVIVEKIFERFATARVISTKEKIVLGDGLCH